MKLSLFDNGEFSYRPPRNGQTNVVLLPGLVAGKWMWQSTLETLDASGYGCLALTQPFAAAHSSASPFKHRVMQLMDRCGIESAVFVGGSFGALVALDCAVEFPERVQLLVLSGAPGSITMAQLGIAFRGKVTRPIVLTVLDRLFFDRSCVSEDNIAETLETFKNLRHVANIIRLMRECGGYDFTPSLARVGVFTLLVWGAQDAISPCDVWERHAKQLRHAAFFKLDRCGHVPSIERPDQFNALLLEHLALAGAAARPAAASLSL